MGVLVAAQFNLHLEQIIQWIYNCQKLQVHQCMPWDWTCLQQGTRQMVELFTWHHWVLAISLLQDCNWPFHLFRCQCWHLVIPFKDTNAWPTERSKRLIPHGTWKSTKKQLQQLHQWKLCYLCSVPIEASHQTGHLSSCGSRTAAPKESSSLCCLLTSLDISWLAKLPIFFQRLHCLWIFLVDGIGLEGVCLLCEPLPWFDVEKR